MPDIKVSTRTEILCGDIDPEADLLLVTDTSATASRATKFSEFMWAAAPYLSTTYDFATGTLLPTVSFTRASSGYRFNSAGLLVSETTDAPRFDHDPLTLVPRGLLVEQAVTGLFERSNEFNNAWWFKINGSVSADFSVAPDGTTTMDKFVEDGTTSSHYLRRSITFVSGTTYEFTIYVRAAGRTWFWMDLPATAFTALQRTYFDLANVTTGSVGPNTTPFIEHVGNSIYRCTIIATATASIAGNVQFGPTTANAVTSYVGDGASGVEVWGAHIVASACRKSPNIATTPVVSQAADVVTITNPRVLTDQCWVIKARTPVVLAGSVANIAFQVDDGGYNNRRAVYYFNGRIYAIAVVGGVAQATLDLGVVAANTDFNIAARFAGNNFAASLNGGAVVTDVSGACPEGLTTARVGAVGSSNPWNSTIKFIETRQTASDAELTLLSQ